MSKVVLPTYLGYLRPICEIVRESPDPSPDPAKNRVGWTSFGASLFNRVADMACCFKHAGFEEEKKWRLLRILRSYDEADSILRFRTSEGLLLPYVLTKLVNPLSEQSRNGNQGSDDEVGVFPLTEVMIGPTHPKDRAELAVKELVKAEDGRRAIGLAYPSIKHTDVPFLG